MRWRELFLAVCLSSCAQAWAQAAPTADEARGALLYRTHCNACHSASIHWREQKKAADWQNLVAQVRRWQKLLGLNWTSSEITEVAIYLNAAYYGFTVARGGEKPERHSRNKGGAGNGSGGRP